MKKRLISAFVMLALFIPIVWLGGYAFDALILIVGILALKELLDIKESDKKIPFLVKAITYLLFVLYILDGYGSGMTTSLTYGLVVITLMGLMMPVLLYQDKNTYSITTALILIGMVLFLGTVFHYAILIRGYGLWYFLYLLVIVMATDTYAFLTGMLIGKHKAIPKISPKKTIEGYIGGLIFGTLFGVITYIIGIGNDINIVLLVAVTFFLSMVSALGDLVFSAIKREYGKKDFSNLIPGHGGILDRFDSLIFIILAFVLCINFI